MRIDGRYPLLSEFMATDDTLAYLALLHFYDLRTI